MTTHFKCASDLECIDLFLFVRFFWCFRFFCYCIFLLVLLLEQGYFNVTLLPMQPVGWGYPPPAAPPTTLLQGPQEQVRTESGPTKTAPSAPKGPTGHG